MEEKEQPKVDEKPIEGKNNQPEGEKEKKEPKRGKKTKVKKVKIEL